MMQRDHNEPITLDAASVHRMAVVFAVVSTVFALAMAAALATPH